MLYNYIRKIYHNLLSKEYGRVFVLNQLIENKNNCSYLEIGVRRGETILKIRANNKIGVDPAFQFDKLNKKLKFKLDNSQNITFHEVTSDVFFEKNTIKFDRIFIDGLHLYEQAMKDILNSLNVLKEGGIIMVHDCNPPSAEAAGRTQCQGVWNGDVWKCLLDIKTNYPSLNYFVLDSDFGLGIITKGENVGTYEANYKKEYIGLDYDYFQKNSLKFLNLKPQNYLFEFIKANRKR